MRLDIIHLPGRLVILVAEARHGRHVVVVLRLCTGFVRRILARVLLDVFCITSEINKSVNLAIEVPDLRGGGGTDP